MFLERRQYKEEPPWRSCQGGKNEVEKCLLWAYLNHQFHCFLHCWLIKQARLTNVSVHPTHHKMKPSCFFHKNRCHVFKHWNQRELSIISALPQLLSWTSFCQTTIQGMSPWPPNLPEKPRCLLTPPPTVVLSPASCSLGLVVVVSVLVELCDVGGKRGWGGGSGVECCSFGGGDGLKVILVRFTTQTQQKKKKKRQSSLKALVAFMLGSMYADWWVEWEPQAL